VSVITPSYNHAPFIRRTIESVLAQDYSPIEHIVVDGGSSDGTVEILREYGARYPDRFRWVSEPDQGQSDALNKGIAMARGEFIGWQNSDDYYYENVFQEPIRYLIDHPEVAMVYSDRNRVDEEGNCPTFDSVGPFRTELLIELDECIPNQAAFMRRDAILSAGGVNPDIHLGMDRDLWLRIGLISRIDYLPGVRGAWRCYSTAKTFSNDLKYWRESPTLLHTALAHPRLPATLKPLVVETLRRSYIAPLLNAVVADDQALTETIRRELLGDDPQLTIWPAICGEAVTGTGLHPPVDPMRLLALAKPDQPAGTSQRRRAVAAAHLFAALHSPLGQANKRVALSLLLRAAAVDSWWLQDKVIVARLYERFFGARAVEALFRVNRLRRRLSAGRS
jgi:GT2 family glycosyltransferase